MRTCKHLSLVAFSITAALVIMPGGTVQAQCDGEPPADSACLPRIIPGAPGLYEVQMDVSTATPDLDAACVAPSIGHTVWFSIAPTQDSHITFSTCDPHTTYDTVVQAYLSTGDCEFPNRIDSWCNDDSPDAACLNECSTQPRSSIVTVQATAGTTYLFEVGSYDNNAAGCDLCLGVNVVIGPTPPVNNDCFDATSISETTLSFDTTGATTDGPPLPGTCDEGAGTSCVQDIWYSYTASCTGNASVDLCGSLYDTRLAVYEGGPDCPGDLLVCNDDFCGLDSRAVFPVEQGTEYLIRVAGFDGSGTGTMTVICSPCLTDFDASGATDFQDLLQLLSTWGPCPGCPADVDGNDVVDFQDLLQLLSAWGVCAA